MTRSRVLRIGLYALLMFSNFGAFCAQTASKDQPKASARKEFTAKTVFPRIKSSVRSALCPSDAKIFDEIAFYFPNSPQIDRVRSGRDEKNRRTVEISEGYVQFNILLMQAVVYSTAKANSLGLSKLWPAYLSYLASVVTNHSSQVRTGVMTSTIPVYYVWARIPENDFSSFVLGHEDAVRDLVLEAFVFALLHEVGHQVLNHPNAEHVDSQTSRENEWEADLYALSGLSKLHMSAVGAAPNFLFYANVDGPIDEITGTHDPALCRAIYLLVPTKGEDLLAAYRQKALSACGRKLAQVEAAIASKGCYRPVPPTP